MSYGFDMSKIQIYEDKIYFILILGLKLHNEDDYFKVIKADLVKKRVK
jgi:hypothetical protein